MLARALSLLALLACILGCGREDAAPLLPGDSQSRSPMPSAAAPSPAPQPLPRDEPRLPMPGPARKRLAAAVAENRACEACHDDIAAEWRGSYHQRSNVDPAYRSAFAVEPAAFCRSCHAPEADPFVEPPEDVSHLGVSCVTCHVTEPGVVLAAARPDGSEASAAPHAVRRSFDFASTGGCAGCHEFRFPRPGDGTDASFMQTTVREHLRSPAADVPCAECHMPVREGRRSHTFAEVRDADWLRASLTATAERSAEDTLRITLTQTRPGHAFPTGDLFRRLEVGYQLSGDDGEVLGRETRHLARHFELVPGQVGRQLTRDDRLEGTPETITLELPPRAGLPSATRLAWWVTYQRVATVGPGTNPADAQVESEVRLFAGELPWNERLPSMDPP
jgi:hypothetical protein